MDSSTWPFTLAVYEWGPDGTPTKWILVEHDKSGSQEAAQAFEGWTRARDGGTLTNEHAAAVGWPLPHPDTATTLQRRPYDRARFSAGQVISDPLIAAIFAPGDFSHVNTSVDPPVFYAQPEPLVLHELFNDALVADAPNETPPVRERVLHVGDRVIVRVIEGGYVEGTVTRLSTYPDGAVSDIVQIDSIAGWHGACAWVQS